MIYLLDVGDIYDLGTVFAQVRGAAMISKLPLFQIFLNLGRGGGGCQIAIFTLSWGEGGGDFLDIFPFLATSPARGFQSGHHGLESDLRPYYWVLKNFLQNKFFDSIWVAVL